MRTDFPKYSEIKALLNEHLRPSGRECYYAALLRGAPPQNPPGERTCVVCGAVPWMDHYVVLTRDKGGAGKLTGRLCVRHLQREDGAGSLWRLVK